MGAGFDDWWESFLSAQGDPASDCAFAFDAQTLAQAAWNAALVYPSRLPIPVSATFAKENDMSEQVPNRDLPPSTTTTTTTTPTPAPTPAPSPSASTDEQGNDGAEQGNDGGEQGS